jgi:hypothetical protein
MQYIAADFTPESISIRALYEELQRVKDEVQYGDILNL